MKCGNTRSNLLEALEPRQLFSAAGPTAQEQYVIQLINRARLDPAAEAARDHIDLNEGLPAGTISTAPKQSLAVNPNLTGAAQSHSQWMLDNQTFAHDENNTDPGAQMSRGGYAFSGGYGWGQNIAWSSHAAGDADTATVGTLEQDLFVDSGVAGRGHRTNLMNGSFKEVGAGVRAGTFTGWPAVMLSEDFAYTAGGSTSFLTGVAYNDAVVRDQFYTPGEGLGGVTVTATRLSDNAVFSTTTYASGGYSLALSPGTYRVAASGGALAGAVQYGSVVIAGQNVERDFVPGGGDGGGQSGGGGGGGSSGSTTDSTPPRAALTGPFQISQGRNTYLSFTVTYTDDTQVNASTLGNQDVRVTGPNGFSALASLVSSRTIGGGRTIVATYQVQVARGKWTTRLAGAYSAHLQARQVADTSGNYAPAGVIGTTKLSHAAPARA